MCVCMKSTYDLYVCMYVCMDVRMHVWLQKSMLCTDVLLAHAGLDALGWSFNETVCTRVCHVSYMYACTPAVSTSTCRCMARACRACMRWSIHTYIHTHTHSIHHLGILCVGPQTSIYIHIQTYTYIDRGTYLTLGI